MSAQIEKVKKSIEEFVRHNVLFEELPLRNFHAGLCSVITDNGGQIKAAETSYSTKDNSIDVMLYLGFPEKDYMLRMVVTPGGLTWQDMTP